MAIGAVTTAVSGVAGAADDVIDTVGGIFGGGGADVTCENQAGAFKRWNFSGAVGANYGMSTGAIRDMAERMMFVAETDERARSEIQATVRQHYPSACPSPSGLRESVGWIAAMAGSVDTGGPFAATRRTVRSVLGRAPDVDLSGGGSFFDQIESLGQRVQEAGAAIEGAASGAESGAQLGVAEQRARQAGLLPEGLGDLVVPALVVGLAFSVLR